MKLVLIGIQGSGKSTQGNLLSKQLGVPYLSTGHIFRAIAKEKTKLGKEIKVLISSGMLIPDEKTIEIVNTYLSRPEYKNGYILDGFPRTLTQVKKFKNHVDKVAYIEIPDKEALWRLAYRKDVGVRDDNTINATLRRIELFHNHTKDVIDYYDKKGKLVVVDGTKSIEEVNDEILKSLGKQYVKNKLEAWNQKTKSIIALVGLPGAGKSEASAFFKEKGLPVIYFGKIVVELVHERKMSPGETSEKLVREELRAQHGKEAIAVMNEPKIRKELENNQIIVIDGMRSWEEYLYLKNKLPDVKLNILCLYADKQIRYQRISHRKERSANFGEQRDISEIIGTNMGPTIAFADFLIKNNFSLEDFHDKLEEVYRAIYFS